MTSKAHPGRAETHLGQKPTDRLNNSSTTKGTPTMVRSLPGVAPRSYRCGNGPTQADANNQSTTNEGLERLVVRISKSRHRTLHSTISPTEQKTAEIHTLLKKAESALTIQIRTSKIGLADFLYKRRVPSVTSPACSCGWHRQTPEHVIMFCRLIDNREQMFRAAGTSDYQQLTESSKTLKILTAWLMKTGLLNQFSLASTLLYNQQ